MAYDPSTPAEPFDPATASAKAYASYPQQFGPPLAGHRIAQNVGRQIQVTSDNAVTPDGLAYTEMLKHPQ